MSNEALGREALKYFHNKALGYSNYDLNFDQLIAKVGGKIPLKFLEIFGDTILNVELSTSKLKNAMESLADAGQGRLPQYQTAWFQALSNEAMNYSWVDAASFVSKETAKDIVKGAQVAGDSILTTLKGLGFVLPFIVIGGLIFFTYNKVKRA